MGGSHSRRRNSFWGNPELNRLRNAETVKPWEIVYDCSLSTWSKCEAALWGFDPVINYTAHCDKRYQPWATRGRYLTGVIPAPETQDIDMSAICMYATMAISEKKNKYMVQCINLPVSYFKERVVFIELVAFMQDFAIVQIATERGRSDFQLVDLKHDKAKLMHTETSDDRPCLFECAVSYDLSKVLLKPNLLYAELHDIKDFDDVIQCVTMPRNGQKSETYNVLEGGAMEVTFAFDPRFRHSRIAMANLQKEKRLFICTFNLDTRRYTNESELTMDSRKYAQKLTFNPEGTFIAVLMRLGPTVNPLPYCYIGVHIYSSDTLQSIHCITQNELTAQISFNYMSPAAIFPMFSNNGAFLVVGVGQIEYDNNKPINLLSAVRVHKVPPALNLQQICRAKIRTMVEQSDVKYLPLPDAIKRFLLFLPCRM